MGLTRVPVGTMLDYTCESVTKTLGRPGVFVFVRRRFHSIIDLASRLL